MDLSGIRSQAIAMSGELYRMLDLVEEGFMSHKAERLSLAMEAEHALNDTERSLTKDIIELSKNSKTKKDAAEFLVLAQMIATFERMGDEITSLVERIEIKVAEKLLFSEDGLREFNETYHATKNSVAMMKEFLKNPDAGLKKKIIDNGFHVKELVERYRTSQAERLVKGECTPLGLNMYYDMLDFTGNLARHSSNIVKLL
jgi:Na+/phosphate symporter